VKRAGAAAATFAKSEAMADAHTNAKRVAVLARRGFRAESDAVEAFARNGFLSGIVLRRQ
jgi:hypothetical protein